MDPISIGTSIALGLGCLFIANKAGNAVNNAAASASDAVTRRVKNTAKGAGEFAYNATLPCVRDPSKHKWKEIHTEGQHVRYCTRCRVGEDIE